MSRVVSVVAEVVWALSSQRGVIRAADFDSDKIPRTV